MSHTLMPLALPLVLPPAVPLARPLARLGASLCLAWAALPALASGSLTALAYQNLGQQAQDISNGAQAIASYGQASSFASRSQASAAADGAGTGPQTHFGASAGSISLYSLWDMGQNLPLDPATAASLELGFNFDLVGVLQVEQVPLSVASTRYTAGVDYISGQQNFQGALSVSYAFVYPFPTQDYTFAGDGLLFGGYARSFTSRHRGAVAGVITFTVANTAANVARASSTLTLSSVSLLGGRMPADGLGVRFDATGLIVPVSQVPEPATGAMWLAGLGGVLWLSRRRHAARISRRVSAP